MKLNLFFTCLPPLPTHFKLHEGMIFFMQNFINSVYIQWILSGKNKIQYSMLDRFQASHIQLLSAFT